MSNKSYKHWPKPVDNDKPIILCFLSGGLDSLATGWELLTNAKYDDFDVFFHHIELINREKRAPLEKQAARNFINFCEEHLNQKITYTENILDMDFLSNGALEPDISYWSFIAGLYANNNYAVRYIAVGRSLTDIEQGVRKKLYIKRGTEIFNATLNYQRRCDVEYLYPIEHLSKKDALLSLPEGLQHKFWSCRLPENNQACGECDTCKTLKALDIQHP